ncbi:hypothetical protein KAW44_06600 [Candidatus Bipolaricaulota bacterium]|nr:hypothetical protein [Candidatus Bipolaricaulota bacterium]
MNDKLTYELLALDPTEDTRSEDAPCLLFMLRGYSALWKTPEVREDEFLIQDGTTMLHVGQVKTPVSEDSAIDVSFGRTFIVTLTGHLDTIEPLREPLTAYLKDQKFYKLYVLKDEVSESIACQLYPYLYRIENLLRGYLINFMSTRVGPAWWEMTVSREMSQKVSMRKKNERVFGKYVENSAYLIDFDELGEIIYEQSSGFVTKEDILKHINELPETPDVIKSFKRDLQSNYQKLFKESFADKGFREKWKAFAILRNKIAHSNLFTAQDLSDGKRLAKEIAELIEAADRKTEDFVITEKEREAIQESIIEASFSWQKNITQEELLRQLSSLEAHFSRTGGFVGVTYFVRHLTNLGYAYYEASTMLRQLDKQGTVEVYKVKNPEGEYEVSAVRMNLQNPANKIIDGNEE